MPGDKRDVENWDESEFGLGTSLIDPVARSDRQLSAEQELMEIYATPKTFDKSGPIVTPQEAPVPRLLPGEEERDRG